MSDLLSAELDYKATIGSRIPLVAGGQHVVYTRTPRTGPLQVSFPEDMSWEFTTEEFFPEETFEIIYLKPESVRHPRHRLSRPIPLEIRYVGGDYHAKFAPIDLFEAGTDSFETIREFGILLADYYDSLLEKEGSLAVNLRRELEILRGIFE